MAVTRKSLKSLQKNARSLKSDKAEAKFFSSDTIVKMDEHAQIGADGTVVSLLFLVRQTKANSNHNKLWEYNECTLKVGFPLLLISGQ